MSTKTKTCAKVRYRSEIDAMLANMSTKRKDREECRWYRCPQCRGWHLTSQR